MSVRIHDSDNVTSLIVDGRPVMNLPNSSSAAGPDWMPQEVVGPHADIELEACTPCEWRCLAEAVRPNTETLHLLEESLYSYGNTDPRYNEFETAEVEVTVNGESWQWFPADPGNEWNGPEGQDWVPVPKAEPSSILDLGAWFTQSMTGMVWSAGLYEMGPALISFAGDDIDGPYFVEISYDKADLNPEALGLVASCGEPFEVTCPNAEPGKNDDECEFTGWEINLDVSGDLSDSCVAELLATCWRPCPRHAMEVELTCGGRWWHWIDAQWTRVRT